MRGYEYQCHDLNKVIAFKRLTSSNQVGNNVLALEFLNEMGSEGWRAINPQDMVVYFERETEVALA